VSLGLHGDTQTVLTGMSHDCRNLVCIGGPRHHPRPLLDRQVERRTRGIPALVAWPDKLHSIKHLAPRFRRFSVARHTAAVGSER
jgi:hypothetical protein